MKKNILLLLLFLAASIFSGERSSLDPAIVAEQVGEKDITSPSRTDRQESLEHIVFDSVMPLGMFSNMVLLVAIMQQLHEQRENLDECYASNYWN